jgi:hypothetical protein
VSQNVFRLVQRRLVMSPGDSLLPVRMLILNCIPASHSRCIVSMDLCIYLYCLIISKAISSVIKSFELYSASQSFSIRFPRRTPMTGRMAASQHRVRYRREVLPRKPSKYRRVALVYVSLVFLGNIQDHSREFAPASYPWTATEQGLLSQ